MLRDVVSNALLVRARIGVSPAAVGALLAGNLPGRVDAVAGLDLPDVVADRLNFATELVSKQSDWSILQPFVDSVVVSDLTTAVELAFGYAQRDPTDPN